MCYRYVAPDLNQIAEQWEFEAQLPISFSVRYNVAPTSMVPVILPAMGTGLRLDVYRWGLIPSWWKQEKAPSLTFNARSEEAAVKPTWRNSYRHERCLMPARGWYEWREMGSTEIVGGKTRKVKQPYFIFSAEAPVMAFAALSAHWQGPGGSEIASCALLTRAATPDLAFIHDRMPVVLPSELGTVWLNPSLSLEKIGEVISSAMVRFDSHPVSQAVNSVHYESPDLIAPV